MAVTTIGAAKNASVILKFSYYISDASVDVNIRGGKYIARLTNRNYFAANTSIANIIKAPSTYLSTVSTFGVAINNYVRVTAIDGTITIDNFGTTQPPITGGTPIKTATATDTSYLISGDWSFDTAKADLVSFNSLDLAPSCTVQYDANGGTGIAPATQTGAASYTVAANTFSRTGYTFKNWNTKADGTGTSYAPGSTITTSASLYAQWTQDKVRTLKSLNAPVLNTQSLGVDAQRVYSFGALVWER